MPQYKLGNVLYQFFFLLCLFPIIMFLGGGVFIPAVPLE